ncbi:scarecrow-like protein 22 [Dorcoceras hygrometricum]|uniref:Scarecrow-like protein 22 n=1 Tax=Dorcoceras hygrometricum TaxID=472368 RepID=A0A2Z7C152_9LAMI|nr:scarecrow-like protein 22 [Dorcoceras hygrometricum]
MAIAFTNVLPVVVMSKFDDFVISSFIERSAGSLIIPSADHSKDIVSLYIYLKDLATGSCLATGSYLLRLVLFISAGTTTGGGTAGET